MTRRTPRPRAAIVVTGSELVRGDRTDLNGPFLAREVVTRGLDAARISIVGDSADELEDALRDGMRADLCIVSGGLGPTHDDRTVEMVARSAGAALVVDPALESQIEDVSRAVAERLKRPYADFARGVRKQATLPEGAVPVGLAGTAPGFVFEAGPAVVVVLPGPPGELPRLWPRALESIPVRRVLSSARPPGRRTLRFYGAGESTIAQALHEAGGEGDGVDVTICARDFEIHVDLIVEPDAEERAEAFSAAVRSRVGRYLFSEQEAPIESIVLDLCRARGFTLATAESCTGGMLAERITRIPGASDVLLGGVVAYANTVKETELGVGASTLAEHGAVSSQTAAAMASGVRVRLGADVGVAVTGIAGPAGGTPEKPVGLVYVHAETPGGSHGTDFSYPADREAIRRRATVAGLHLVRRLLIQNSHESA
jgi:nicotinamide-nucleotide amidase